MSIRLTLRTLLAYLDDTLDASRSREIGQKVAESDYAKKLTTRIKSILRDPKVIAPPAHPDFATVDANLVAEYLDSTMDEHRLADFERICLESDTNLAEVAGVHQILTMVLGEPAHVSVGARERMYGLLTKKPATVHHQPVRPVGPTPGPSDDKARSSLSIEMPSPVAAKGAEPAAGNRWATFGLVAVLLLATALVVYMATLPAPSTGGKESDKVARVDQKQSPPQEGTTKSADESAKKEAASSQAPPADMAKSGEDKTATPRPASVDRKESDDVAAKGATEQRPPTDAGAAEQKAADKAADDRKTKGNEVSDKLLAAAPAAKVMPKEPPPESAPAPSPPKPADVLLGVAVGNYRSTEGILLRQKGTDFVRLKAGDAVATGETLVNFHASRSTIELKTGAKVELVDQTRLTILQGPDLDLAMVLLEGKVVLHSADKPVAYRLGAGGGFVELKIATGNGLVAAEHRLVTPLTADNVAGSAQGVDFFVIRGEMELVAGTMSQKLAGGDEILFGEVAGLGQKSLLEPPPWIFRPTADERELRAAERLAERIPDERSQEALALVLQEAVMDRTRENRKLAVHALAAIEAYRPLASLLNNPQRETRQLAISLLQLPARRDVETSARLRTVLVNQFPDESDSVLALLRGFSDASLRLPETYDRLITYLDSPQLAIRELAITLLREYTDRDFGFTPDASPMRRDAAINQWRRWLVEQTPDSLPAAKGKKAAAPAKGEPPAKENKK